MTDVALAQATVPTSHMAALSDTERALVECMVNDGLSRKAAAKKIGVSDRWAWELMRKAEVLKAIKDETQVLRTSVRPRAILNLDEIGRQRRNLTAAVAASRSLMGEDEHSRTSININITPGYAMDLTDRTRERVIEHQDEVVIRVDGVSDGEQGS